MATFDWPAGWIPNRFEMRIMNNTRTFESAYNRSAQAVDLIGEYFRISLDLPGDVDLSLASAREAFFDRLVGPVNTVRLWNLRRPQPFGTLRDSDGGAAQWRTASNTAATWQTSASTAATWSYGPPVLAANVAQLSNLYPLACVPGRTLQAGDQISIAGQTVRVMANAVADASGGMLVEALPRARAVMGAGAPVVTFRPTVTCVMKGDGVPTVYRPGVFEGASIEFEEAP